MLKFQEYPDPLKIHCKLSGESPSPMNIKQDHSHPGERDFADAYFAFLALSRVEFNANALPLYPFRLILHASVKEFYSASYVSKITKVFNVLTFPYISTFHKFSWYKGTRVIWSVKHNSDNRR